MTRGCVFHVPQTWVIEQHNVWNNPHFISPMHFWATQLMAWSARAVLPVKNGSECDHPTFEYTDRGGSICVCVYVRSLSRINQCAHQGKKKIHIHAQCHSFAHLNAPIGGIIGRKRKRRKQWHDRSRLTYEIKCFSSCESWGLCVFTVTVFKSQKDIGSALTIKSLFVYPRRSSHVEGVYMSTGAAGEQSARWGHKKCVPILFCTPCARGQATKAVCERK